MSMTREPKKLDDLLLLRLAKFLVSHDEIEWLLLVQDVPERSVVYGDSGWGGLESRRITTGTFEQLGSHPIDCSCSTQHVIALSSGEAELYATGRAAAGGLQSVQLLAEAEVLTDSTENIGMHNRIGSGRARHLDVRWLWTREAVQTGRFTLKKVGTTENVSDLTTTKYHDEERLEALMQLEELRKTKGFQDAASAAGESRRAAVNAVLSTQASELNENILRLGSRISSLGERTELGKGRVSGKGHEQAYHL